jgi:hypothetical protein
VAERLSAALLTAALGLSGAKPGRDRRSGKNRVRFVRRQQYAPYGPINWPPHLIAFISNSRKA